MEYVDINNPQIKKAIDFIEEYIIMSLEKIPSLFLKSYLEKIPLVYYIPALTLKDKIERDSIINKYKSSRPDQIQYYLIYHNCDEFAIFYWTILRVNNINTRIIHQEEPSRHTYLQKDSGEIIDALFYYCGISYQYQPDSAEKFDTPYDFYINIFISKNDRQDWEIALLKQLRDLE